MLLRTPLAIVLNGTRFVGSVAATRSGGEIDVDCCAADWEYTFVTQGIIGSERVTRAQVRFMYLCGARKVCKIYTRV